MNTQARALGNGVLYLGWLASRMLTFRPGSALQRLHWYSYWTPLLFAIGGLLCGLRWGHDPLSFLRNAGSFVVWTSLVTLVGIRCKHFIMGYCVLSATFDVLGMLLIWDAPDGSPIRVSLSAYELLATGFLIVAAVRMRPPKTEAV